MEEIKKQIEEEASKASVFIESNSSLASIQNNIYSCVSTYNALTALSEFKHKVNNILSKWQDSERWRKVEEELPEMGFRVLIKNEFNVIHMGYIDTVGDWRYCLNNDRINAKPTHWKPIH